MMAWIIPQDNGTPKSEAAGFELNYRCYVLEGSATTLEFDSSALLPPSASAAQRNIALIDAAILAAAAQGKPGLQANNCRTIP